MKCQRCEKEKEFSEFSEIRSVCNDCHFEIESAYFEDTYNSDDSDELPPKMFAPGCDHEWHAGECMYCGAKSDGYVAEQ